MPLIKCFGDRIGEWDLDTDRVKIIGYFAPNGEAIKTGCYGRGFMISHVKSMGEIKELDPKEVFLTYPQQ
jgi:hypothetical protein